MQKKSFIGLATGCIFRKHLKNVLLKVLKIGKGQFFKDFLKIFWENIQEYSAVLRVFSDQQFSKKVKKFFENTSYTQSYQKFGLNDAIIGECNSYFRNMYL